MCSSPPFPDQAMAVVLRCETVDPRNTFSDHEMEVDLRCARANTKTPRSFARLDPVFARDNNGRSVIFSIKKESTRLATSSPFSKKHNGREPPLVKILLPCPSTAPEDAHKVYGSCFVFLHAFPRVSGYVRPSGTGRRSDTARRASGDSTASSLISWTLFP